ncbi:MAG: hypothetical protein R6V44_12015 [Paracoccaceae bacterium]
MRILFRYLLYLLLLVAAGFAGWAMIADLPAPQRERELILGPAPAPGE